MRQQILAKRNSLTSHDRAEKSTAIADKIMGLAQIIEARAIFVYMHFRSEVETFELINRMLPSNKTITIPYTKTDTHKLLAIQVTDLAQQVAPGYCGIPEPIPELVDKALFETQNIDVVIVPGSVFDRNGGRLGYGGGYYDRFLTNATPGALRLGLAFELQLVDRVPVESHDQPMDLIATEENIYDCRRNRYA